MWISIMEHLVPFYLSCRSVFIEIKFITFLCRVYELERQLKTPDKFLHPCFETMNWYAAVYLLDKLKGKGKKTP